MNKIRTIGMEDLDNLGIDDEGKLYWKGQLVTTRQQVRLEWGDYQRAMLFAVRVHACVRCLWFFWALVNNIVPYGFTDKKRISVSYLPISCSV